jgi:hypothetical protein
LKLDYLDLLQKCAEASKSAEKFRVSHKEPDWRHKENTAIRFNQFLGELSFFLQNPHIKPAGITDENFKKVKPIFERYVENGTLKPEALDIFKM